MGNNRYRLLALDMDGTLLTEDKTVAEATRTSIRAAMEAGIVVMFATGRGMVSARPYAEELGLLDTPMVTVNGGEVWRKPGELLHRTRMPAAAIMQLRDIALRHGEPWYWAYSVGQVYNKELWPDNAEQLEWLKFGYYTENREVLAAIAAEAAAAGPFEMSNSHPCNIELNPLGVTKASGLRHVCKLLGIDMSEAVAVGDSLNDVPMLREAGLGVAMGNAQEEVKAVADAVTLSNEEDGVGHVIRTWMLSG